ncbi:MAG TPA: FG-GAP-like repeat-containing protein [Blastocatellia bacterium]|nr:FG-GAP-like repeat-containing protein [Blastocatellia bacterium]
MKRLSNSWIILMVMVSTTVLAIDELKPSAAKPPAFKMAPGSPINVGPMAGEPVIADSNHDGNLDIILACGTCCGSAPDPLSGHVQVLLGDGRGGFKRAEGSPIPVGSSARKVAVGDANRDGHLDIFVAQHDSYEVVALLGNGRGGFRPAPGSPFVAASGPHAHPRAHTHAITSGDVNGDGNLDLLTTNANDNSVSILLGDGKGSFAPSSASPIKAGRHPYDTVVLNDVNNDGKSDLVTPNLHRNAAMVMLGDGTAGFTPAPGAPFALGPRPGYVAVADINDDGKADLIATHDDDPLVAVLLGDGKGGFNPTPESPLRPSNPVWGVAVADLNGDGKKDLAMGAQLNHGVTIMLGDGKGGFVSAPGSPMPAGKITNYLAVADLNRDGKQDIVASSYGSGEITVFLNETSTSRKEITTEKGVTEGAPAPDFDARALDGKTVKLSDLRGKVVILDFMASWCGNCVATLPEIKGLYDRFERSKVEIVSVSLDGGETTDSTLRDLKELLANHPVDWPVIFDDTGWDNAIARSYGVNKLPAHIIIDREGIIRLIAAGGDKKKMNEVRSVLQRLM